MTIRETAASSQDLRPTVRSARVEVISGPDAGAHLRLDSDRAVIGTHRSADLVLTDPKVSRFHLELELLEDGVRIRDLGSLNGTTIDTVSIESVKLRGPAIVELGASELRVDLVGERIELELAPQEHFGAMIGASPAMQLVFRRLQQASQVDVNVLLEGERGSGKNLAAEALHEHGPRRDGPFDVVDCGLAILDVEALLFGTGDRRGALERCHGGTLVLDEVGSLALNTQRVLARVLESKLTRRLRGSVDFPADVRFLSMSRHNLRADVNHDKFLPALYELLATARIRLPALREHLEDVPLLVAHFLGELGARGAAAAEQLLSAEAVRELRAQPWAGNIRELRSHVERAIAAPFPPDDHSDPPLIDRSLPLREARERWTRYFERAYVEDVLERSQGNVTAAAIAAGVDRVYMHRMITRCGLREKLKTRR